MRKLKKARRTVEVVEDVVCNRCGGTCLIEREQYGLAAAVEGGYNSTHLADFTIYQFDLCEKCLAELFAGFKIKPDKCGGYPEDAE
jgi:hypothetical protein